MKKLLCVLCSLCLFLSPLQAYAMDSNIDSSMTMEVSELSYFQELRSYSDEELKAKGMSAEEIDYIRNFDLVEAIKERASLPETTLKEFGYTEKEITQLKSILNRRSVSEEEIIKEVRGATLTLTVQDPITTKSKYTYEYSFKWSSCPVFIQDDLLAITWSATNSSGSPINVAIDKTNSSLSTIYKYTGGAPTQTNPSYKWNPVNEYRAAKIKFDMGTNLGEGMSYWTYSGSGKIVLKAVVSNTIYELYLKFGYGHSVVTGTPSVSFSGSGMDIGFDFGWTTQTLATYSKRYRHDGVYQG